MSESAFDRHARLVYGDAMLPEEAFGSTSGDLGSHRGHPCWTGRESERAVITDDGRIVSEDTYYATEAFPDCAASRLRFCNGWRKAGEGTHRILLRKRVYGTMNSALDPAEAKGYDTYVRVRGPIWWRRREAF